MKGKISQTVLEPPVGWLPPARGTDQEQRTRRHSRAGEQAGTKESSSRWSVRSPPRPASPRCGELPVCVQGHAGTSHQKILQKKRKDGAAVLPSACPQLRAAGIHETGRARKGMHVCRQPSPSLPSSAPRTQKGPLAGALVSFSLVRPEPDTVIGTTRRFQPWRELPSWLRAGGSVR